MLLASKLNAVFVYSRSSRMVWPVRRFRESVTRLYGRAGSITVDFVLPTSGSSRLTWLFTSTVNAANRFDSLQVRVGGQWLSPISATIVAADGGIICTYPTSDLDISGGDRFRIIQEPDLGFSSGYLTVPQTGVTVT